MNASGTSDRHDPADAATTLTDAPGRRPSERSIFLEALEHVTPDERTTFLDRACAGDPAMRARVEALLRSHEDASQFLEGDVAGRFAALAAGGADLPAAVRSGGRVGPYKLLEKLGEGGMGVVFMAEQEHPVRRTVALKIIKPGMDSAQVVARFEAERQALAMMDHANIAKVLDAGATEAGGPYFVMELVRGVPITRYCDEHRLGVPERLELFVAVCRAVQHAHQKGVIHRDLKPSNVMVTSSDGKPVPKVIDFGIAKAIDQRLTERTLFTQYGALVGTLEYMAPEQAETSSADGADTRSDVYSLGVLLYELLTGTTPLHAERARAAGLAELLRMVREDEPPAPSTRLRQTAGSREAATEAAARRGSDPGTLAGVVRGELDWIVMRCLEKDRTRRYETADALATDVRRYLHDEPVAAGPVSRSYALRKFARRHRGLIATVGAVAAALVLGTALSTYGLIEARRERAQAVAARAAEGRERQLAVEARALAEASANAARSEAQKAEEVSRFLRSMIASANPLNAKGGDPTVREVVDVAAQRLEQGRLAAHPDVEAALRQTLGVTYLGLGLNAAAEAQLKEALDLQLPALGADHPDVATTLHLLGTAASARGDHPAAAGYQRRAYDIRRKAYGEDDRRVVAPLLQLAEALARAGERAEAEALQARAAELAATTAGERSEEAAFALHDRATLLLRQNDPAGAEALYRRALEMCRERFGDDHRVVATLLLNVAITRMAQGDDAGAEPLLRDALARRRKALGSRHPSTYKPLSHLQSILARRHDPEAARLGVEMMEVEVARLTGELKALPDDPRLIKARAFLYGRLGRTLEEAADWETAMRLEPDEFQHWYAAAFARFQLGDDDAGRTHARDMLARFGKSDDMATQERVAKTLLLSPGAGAAGDEMVAAAMSLIDRALPAVAGQERFLGWYELTKSLAEYRAGRFAESAEWAEKAAAHVPKIGFGDLRHPEGARLAVAAMAHHRLGHADQAARLLREGARLWEAYPKPGEGDLADGSNRHFWEVLLREAHATLAGPGSRPSAPVPPAPAAGQ